MLSWSNSDILSGPAMSQNVWHKNQLKHPTTEFSHVSILASFRERICAFMVLQQPLIWSQPTTASPACPNLMIITTPHASFLSAKIWHWYLTIRQHLIFFVPKTSVLLKGKCWERRIIICTSSRCTYTKKTGGLQRGASSQSNSSHSGPAVQIGARQPGFHLRAVSKPRLVLAPKKWNPHAIFTFGIHSPTKRFLCICQFKTQ